MPAKTATKTARKASTTPKTTRSPRRRPAPKPTDPEPTFPFSVHPWGTIPPLLGLPDPAEDQEKENFSDLRDWSKREAAAANDLLLKGYRISLAMHSDKTCQAVAVLSQHLPCKFSAKYDIPSGRILVWCTENSVEDWDVCDDE